MKNLLKRIRSNKRPGTDFPGIKKEKTVPPHITTCKECEGTGICNGCACLQCSGSGRVIVTSTIVTYITAYLPEVLTLSGNRYER